ncbi:hypothetical protein EGR_07263 [Echinococcus granulosus]|uniref:Uncharacterized protein n=1 Tax=Echinococcus granulosus TaxID=6210 RepID=W6UBG2_ECHGR|nr:hypothetical protein EGR_07263 [Echinococcus granulosus]EUB57901.1 hypothetical protein EGR_07263 [Echinococcus granulosus]
MTVALTWPRWPASGVVPTTATVPARELAGRLRSDWFTVGRVGSESLESLTCSDSLLAGNDVQMGELLADLGVLSHWPGDPTQVCGRGFCEIGAFNSRAVERMGYCVLLITIFRQIGDFEMSLAVQLWQQSLGYRRKVSLGSRLRSDVVLQLGETIGSCLSISPKCPGELQSSGSSCPFVGVTEMPYVPTSSDTVSLQHWCHSETHYGLFDSGLMRRDVRQRPKLCIFFQ